MEMKLFVIGYFILLAYIAYLHISLSFLQGRVDAHKETINALWAAFYNMKWRE